MALGVWLSSLYQSSVGSCWSLKGNFFHQDREADSNGKGFDLYLSGSGLKGDLYSWFFILSSHLPSSGVGLLSGVFWGSLRDSEMV